MSTPRILTLDVETAPMLVYVFGLWKQNVGINQIVEPTRMLCWAAKWHGDKRVHFASEWDDGVDEMRARLFGLMDEADYYCTWNGISFDIPQIQREFLIGGNGPVPPAGQIDLMKVARKSLYLPSYKLDYVSQYLGVGQKMPTGGFDLWRGCLDGDVRAQKTMARYNKHDVVITDGVLEKLMPYVNLAPTSLILDTDAPLCSNPLCRSVNLQSRGVYRTALSEFRRYRCSDCGKWSRARTATVRAGLRGVVA